MELKHYYGALQSIEDVAGKVAYLQELRGLSEAVNWDVNWNKLIECWESGDWPHKRKRNVPVPKMDVYSSDNITD